MHTLAELQVAVIGLGYVGLPLAVAFGAGRPVTGFDIDPQRIAELRDGVDRTLETSASELAAAVHLRFTTAVEDLRTCNCFIITVPTPIDVYRRPDLAPLLSASAIVAGVLKPNDLVIYESTVYPGCTEEDCVPVLEQGSGLRYRTGADAAEALQAELATGVFYCGYSPERINPGDKQHRLDTICKVTSGSTPAAAALVDTLYQQVVTAGTHRASSIRVAEAAKVIENTQRDVNIALVNELALIFHRLGIDTMEVLQAAGSKWNFLPFRPGLVGGHCIGVDPYYLTHKAQQLGYHPEVILAGRRINDSMGAYVANETVKLMLRKGLPVLDSRILVLGLTFKENCPDLRNSKVVDVVHTLESYQALVDVWDPHIAPADAQREYGLTRVIEKPVAGCYDALVLAVGHREFIALGAAGLRDLGKPDAVLFDVKSVLPVAAVDGRL